MPDINFPYDIPLINQCSVDDYVFIHVPGGIEADIRKVRIRELPLMRNVFHDNTISGKGTASDPLHIDGGYRNMNLVYSQENNGKIEVRTNGVIYLYYVRVNCRACPILPFDTFHWNTYRTCNGISSEHEADIFRSGKRSFDLFTLPTQHRPKQTLIGLPNLKWRLMAIRSKNEHQHIRKEPDEQSACHYCNYFEIKTDGVCTYHEWYAWIDDNMTFVIPYIKIDFDD